MTDHQLILVTWLDHAAIGGWEEVSKFHGPSTVHSVGWLYREDKKGITIAACYSPEGKEHQTSNLQYILKGCITARQVIKLSKIRKK